MTITTSTTQRGHTVQSQPSFLDLVSSEWIKIRTVASTVWCLTLFTLITTGIATLAALNHRSDAAAPDAPVAIDKIVMLGNVGLSAGQLAIVVLAASAIGSEYGSGMIRTSLATVPWRRRWLAAKVLVVALVALVAGTVVNVVAFAIGYAVAPDVTGSLTEPGIIRSVLGGGLYLSGLALLTLCVATLTRSTAGGIITMSAMIYVMPFFLLSFDKVLRFLPAGLVPGNAGWTIMQPEPTLGGLQAWSGFAVLCAWGVAAMTGAVYALDKRDI